MPSKRELLRIPHPQAQPGDEVSVENYRMRPPMWEYGVCERAEFILGENQRGRWSYQVLLNRISDSGSLMRLWVGDAGIARDE